MKTKTTGWIILGGVGIALTYVLLKASKVEAGDAQTFLRRISPYSSIIREYADEFTLDEDLIKALIWQESSRFPNAERKENNFYSYGLCGLTLIAARDMGYLGTEEDLIEPDINIHYATAYLRYQIDRYGGDVSKGLVAYNAGHWTGNLTYANQVWRKMKAIEDAKYKILTEV